jgi:hypothetical protein
MSISQLNVIGTSNIANNAVTITGYAQQIAQVTITTLASPGTVLLSFNINASGGQIWINATGTAQNTVVPGYTVSHSSGPDTYVPGYSNICNVQLFVDGVATGPIYNGLFVISNIISGGANRLIELRCWTTYAGSTTHNSVIWNTTMFALGTKK